MFHCLFYVKFFLITEIKGRAVAFLVKFLVLWLLICMYTLFLLHNQLSIKY